MNATLRDATRDDLEKVLEIDGASFSQPWSAQSFGAAFDDRERSIFLVAQIDETVCGFGVAWHVGDEGEIATLAVAEQQRGQHIGEQILGALLQELASRGATQIFLEVRPSNLGAQRLYEKLGFIEIAVRKNYYANGENAIVMCRGARPAP